MEGIGCTGTVHRLQNGGRIIDNLQIEKLQIDNGKIGNRQIVNQNLQIDNLQITFPNW